MTALGQLGKWAESKVKVWMQRLSDADAQFDFYRFPDARAGSFQSVPADFEAVHRGVPYLIEVKQVIHSHRLPAKNFSADKVARMRKREMAGAKCWVIVCHMPEKVWRLVPLSVFLERKPSWDLSKQIQYADLSHVMDILFETKQM